MSALHNLVSIDDHLSRAAQHEAEALLLMFAGDLEQPVPVSKIRKLTKANPTLPPADPDDQSDAAKRARRKIEREAKQKLNEMRGDVSQNAADAYENNDNADEAIDDIDLDAMDGLASSVADSLHDVFHSAGQRALDSLKVDDKNIYDLFNKDADDYARNRGAELVGRKWVNGRLVDNPDAKWAISQTTRDGLRDMIAKSYQDGKTPAELKEQIEDSYLFSDHRARMIAQTETAKASVRGSMSAWERTGVVKGKSWQCSNDPNICDECQDNADEGVIAFEDDFPSGDDAPPQHPNCRCALAPSLEGPEDEDDDDAEKVVKYSPTQARDAHSRWGEGDSELANLQRAHDQLHEHIARQPNPPAAAVSNYHAQLKDLYSRVKEYADKNSNRKNVKSELKQAAEHLSQLSPEDYSYSHVSTDHADRALSGLHWALKMSAVQKVAKLVKVDDDQGRGWIAVDLDSTLAVFNGDRTQVGPPTPPDEHDVSMVDRVKQWLANGEDVRIFTARVADDPDGTQKKMIEAWCKEHIGQVLPITNIKDHQMIEQWDDRAVRVGRNTGVQLSPSEKLVKSESEERDSHGRWTSGGDSPIEFKPSDKMLRALESRVPCGVEKQRMADEQERILSRAIGIPRTGDNSAFDLRNDEVAVELKCMQDARNAKVTMSNAALGRKLAESQAEGLKAYTVVADKRSGGGGTHYYIKQGLGSFRLGSMQRATISEIRSMIHER